MGPRTTQLSTTLRDLVRLLERCSEAHWAEWIARDLREIESGDLHGVDHFMSAFGGMGSLDDLVLHPVNGHSITESDVAGANEDLDRLRSTAWSLAHEIRRVAER